MARRHAVAIDLGATSGRVVLGELGREQLALTELARFRNGGVRVHGVLHWDVLGLYRGMLEGLQTAASTGAAVGSVGVDTWAVDFGLIDRSGGLIANPLHYRDGRSGAVVEEVLAAIPLDELYSRTGIQLQPFNTVFQLVAAARRGELEGAESALLLPDLFNYWLTGQRHAELTNASSTQLVSAETDSWDHSLIERLGLPARLFPPLCPPGTLAGTLLSEVATETGLDASVAVTSVASHDTASAVLAVPAQRRNFAYISSGTWSLVGLELDRPILSEASRRANFTNERGVDGTVRFLRNVTGFVLLEECLSDWRRQGQPSVLEELVAEAARAEPRRRLIDVDAPGLLGSGDLAAAVAAACRRSGQPSPSSRSEVVRCLLDSLAAAYAAAVALASSLADREVEIIHLVGGGARNALLAQLTADACNLPVVAGPVEAATVGNLLVQGRALGVLPESVTELRQLVAEQLPVSRFIPRASEAEAWRLALARLPPGRGVETRWRQ